MANINRDDAPQSNKSFQFSIWKRLGPFIKPYRWLLLLIIVTNIIISIVDVLLPLFQRYAVDNFIEQKSLQGFQTFIIGYLAVIVLQVLSFVFYTLSAMKMEMRMGRDLKRACFVHLQTLSFSYYNVTPVGYILARVMSDTNKIASITAWDLIDILWALTYVVCAFISMAMLDLRLALMVMVIVPVIAVLTAYFQKKILFWNRKVRAINSRITGAFNEGIMGAKTSKTLVIEDTGIGIQAEDLPRVFDKGYTGYNGRRDKKSTGIGLYLCRQIMNKLGHTLTIESEVGRGTRVKLGLSYKTVSFA